MKIFLLQVTNFPIILDYRFSKWPLFLNMLISIMIIFLFVKQYKQGANLKVLTSRVDNRNYLLLLFASLIASGLLYFYQLLEIGLLVLTLVSGYFLYKNLKGNSASTEKNEPNSLYKKIAFFVYSLLIVYSFHEVRKGSLNMFPFLLFVFSLTAILVRFLENNRFALNKTLIENKTSRRVIIFIFCSLLLSRFLYTFIEKIFAGIYNQSVLQYVNATFVFTKITIIIAGAILFIFAGLWFVKTNSNENNSTSLFQKTIFSYTLFTFLLFYFGNLGLNSFSARIKKYTQSYSTSLSDTNIDGVYKYTGSNYSNKVESNVYINGSNWSATYIEKDESFETIVESSSSSGYIKNKNLYDDNGFELGYISGRTVYLQINGRSISHSK